MGVVCRRGEGLVWKLCGWAGGGSGLGNGSGSGSVSRPVEVCVFMHRMNLCKLEHNKAGLKTPQHERKTKHSTTPQKLPLTFLLRCTISRTPIRHQLSIIPKRLPQHAPTPIHITRPRTTDHRPRRLIRRRIRILLPIRSRGFRVVEGLLRRDARETVNEIEVQLEDFGAVDAVLSGVVTGGCGVGEVAVLGEVARGVVGGDLGLGEFVLEVELDGVLKTFVSTRPKIWRERNKEFQVLPG